MSHRKLSMESLELRTLLTAVVGDGGLAAQPHSFVVGDVNDDGVFDSGDLVQMFQSGHYEDNIENNSGYQHGDLNFDRDVDSADLVFAFQHGVYEPGPTGQTPHAWETPDLREGFCSSDLVALFVHDRYDDFDRGATRDQGDFNGDGFFDSSDLVLAWQVGGDDYEQHLNCIS